MNDPSNVKKALDNFYKRQKKVQTKSKRKNKKPEKQIEDAILKYASENGWLLTKVEAKAVYSKAAGRYLHSQASKGLPDLIGSCPDATACMIEVKAPGRKSTLREGQREFLLKLIGLGGFAIVLDQADNLHSLYDQFLKARSQGLHKKFLLTLLPPQKKSDTKPLFDE